MDSIPTETVDEKLIDKDILNTALYGAYSSYLQCLDVATKTTGDAQLAARLLFHPEQSPLTMKYPVWTKLMTLRLKGQS